MDQLLSPLANKEDSESVQAQVLHNARQQLVSNALRAGCILGAIATLISSSIDIANQNFSEAIFHILSIAFAWILWLAPIPYRVRVLLMVMMIYVVAVGSIYQTGVSGRGRMVFVLCIIFTVSLYNLWVGLGIIALSTITFAIMAYMFASGMLTNVQATTIVVEDIPSHILSFLMVTILSVIFIAYFINAMKQAWYNERKLVNELQLTSVQLQAALARESNLSESLRVALAQEKEIGAIRERLITTVSHEFRTPMAMIRTSSGLLHNHYEKLSAERRTSHFQNIDDGIQRLATLTDQIVTTKLLTQEDLDEILTEISI